MKIDSNPGQIILKSGKSSKTSQKTQKNDN